MRARAISLLLLVVLPLASASPGASRDLIVLGTAQAPPGAIPLHVVPGFIVPDATRAVFDRLLGAPGVERLAWSAPLERHGAIESAGAVRSDLALGLTRADELAPLAGRGVTVAVLDSGIDALHPDLAGRVVENVKLLEGRFVPATGDADGHGTHVAGVVAASGATSEGRWRGVAPEAQLVGIDISSRFTTASALLAYDWLLLHHREHGIRVVVNAWGRVPDGTPFDAADPTIRAIDRLVDEGVIVVFSASNRGPAPDTVSVEARNPRVVTVGATDASGLLMPYSARGRSLDAVKPDVVAPGEAIVGLRSAQTSPDAADPDALHRTYSGTSQAAPHVAGIIALLLERDPSLAPDDVAAILRASAVDLGEPGLDTATGAGLVDARDALRGVEGEPYARDHLFVAGGVDEQRDRATLGPTRRSFFGLVDRPTLLWETTFAVKPGAQSLGVEIASDAATTLTAEAGRADRAELRWTGESASLADPAPGVWTLRLYGTLPVATDTSALVRVALPAHPERALEAEGRPPPPSFAAGEQEAPWIWAIPGTAVAAALVALVVAASTRKASRDPYLEAKEPATRER